jgi:hypothetical protein
MDRRQASGVIALGTYPVVRPRTDVQVWLVLALIAAALAIERMVALLISAREFPGISVLGIVEVLFPIELSVLSLIRWRDLRVAEPRRWGWLLLAALSAFVALLLIATATLASRPPGLAPTGLAVVLAAATIAALAWQRSRRA